MTRAGRPLVTVLLPCYNAAAFLRQTLDSLITQTYRELEILAIDDGSTDSTGEILAEYAARDRRVRLMPNGRNHGLIYTLNQGVALASGTLIARMDADDMAEAHRIDAQVAYFEQYPDTELLSTDVSYFGLNGQLLYNPDSRRFSSRTLQFLLFFFNPLCHSSVMGRRDTFRAHPYSTDALHVEDFELWHRMLEHGVVIRNLPERLLRFRCSPDSVSRRHESTQTAQFLAITSAAIHRYFRVGVEPDVLRIVTNRMVPGAVHGSHLRAALMQLQWMRQEYITRERLDRSDGELIDAFLRRHVVNVVFHAYKRSARTDPARHVAAREMVRATLWNPLPTWRLVAQKGRERLSR